MHHLLKIAKNNRPLTALVAGTAVVAALLLVGVIWPAYCKPSNRTYESKFGYAALRKALGLPSTAQVSVAQRRKIAARQLGEGRVTATPVRVPIVPTDRIVSVAVVEGERVVKGQILAELDATQAQFRVESAQLLVESAQAELERVKLGSTYNLTQERPEREGINLEASKKQIQILRERHASMSKLFDQGSASRIQLLEVESKLAEAERDLQSSQLGVDVSSKGQPQSTAIAENNLKQQRNLLEQRLRELADFHVRAPADGVLESVLVNAGEYNRNPGEIGFVIASGLWFEAHIDQTAIRKVNVGDKAQVQLEAFPGEPIVGSVSRIVPIVTYSSSGPEAKRPVRAMGTGAPEWPTTFSVIVEFSADAAQKLAPGLTGFAAIDGEREALSVPLSAVTLFSARQGAVNVATAGGQSARKVTLGDSWQDWVEIRGGLEEGEKVLLAPGAALPAEHSKEAVALR